MSKCVVIVSTNTRLANENARSSPISFNKIDDFNTKCCVLGMFRIVGSLAGSYESSLVVNS